MKHRHMLICGGSFFALFLLAAAFPKLLTSYDPKEMFDAWIKPCSDHLLGTNSLGYDIFTELVYGTRRTLLIGLSSSILTLLLGVTFGILSTFNHWIGRSFEGIINIFVLLPKLVTLIVLATFIGSSTQSLILLISSFSWVGMARAVRAKVIHLNTLPFIENCVIQGYDRLHIAIYHILPNLSDIVISRFLLGVNSCIMMESTLSFLGLGDLYHPTWGTMVNFAYKRGAMVRHAYGYLIAPGICIMMLELSFYLVSQFFEHHRQEIRDI